MRRFDRARGVAHRHPWLTWGTIAAVVAVLAGVIPGVLWVIERFQTTADAKAHANRDEQKFAWVIWGQAKTNTILLRNRLNDCNVKPTVKRSAMEQAVCLQYQQEYDEENRRARDLYKQALEHGKEP